jgi:hypothetical protein
MEDLVMALHITCPCGKPLRIPESFLGKRMRCPGCGEPLQVAAEEDRPTRAHVRAERPEPRSAPAPRRHEEDRDDRDSRDREYRERDRDRDDDDRDSRDDYDDRPRKKSKKKKARKRSLLPLLLGLAAGLFLFCGMGGVLAVDYLWLNLIFGGSVNDLAMIPGDAQAFISIRVADAWKLDSTRKQWEKLQIKGESGQDFWKDMENDTGLTPSDWERFTVVVQDGEKEEVWFVMKGNRAYDKGRIQRGLRNSRTVKHEGQSYLVGMAGKESSRPAVGPPGMMGGGGLKSKETAFYFASRRVLVAGTEPGIKRLLTFLKAKKTKGPLDESIRLAESREHHLVAGVNLPSKARSEMRALIPPEQQKYAVLMDFQAVTLRMSFGEVVPMEIIGHYNNENQARESKKQLDDIRGQVSNEWAKLGGLLEAGGGPEAKKATDTLKNTLNSLTIEQQGVNVTLKLKVDTRGFEGLMNQPKNNPWAGFGPPGMR